MRVKRLEVQGFKSFKDKTVIQFDHTITGIVGPNGCGKSNIVDAFFWVMGEQSYKHMRGSGSGDLIFNGSTKYAPLETAEATLVMETEVVDTENAPAGATAADIPTHTRKKEISVTRRVYRDGHGEYLINGVPARLKDIQELFMDTGVGAKGYSVIEQGQIGKIVNSKPEERRLLIEEAAGIAKYKARKKESLRKLESAESNLSRLNDVIQEIERGLASLERQAQKARKYKEYKEELIDKEMTWGRRKVRFLKETGEETRIKRESLEHELTGLRAELQTIETDLETHRIRQLDDSKRTEELQNVIQTLSGQLTQQQSSLELSRNRQQDLDHQITTLESERLDLSQWIEKERQLLDARESEVIFAQTEYDSVSNEATQADHGVRSFREEIFQARKKLDHSKRELVEGLGKISELNSRSSSMLARIESGLARLERVKHEEAEWRERLSQVQDEHNGIESELLSWKQARSADQAALETEKAKLIAMNEEVASLEQNREEAIQSVAQVRSRLQSLEELEAAHEGLESGPKAVLKQFEAFSLIADLLDVDKGFEKAVEGWLEERLQNLVASSPLDTLKAIDRLRESSDGRAVIHLLAGGIESDPIRIDAVGLKHALEAQGLSVLRSLDEVVRVKDHPARGLVERMISRVILVESLTPALQAISENRLPLLGDWSLVSQDGQALSYESGRFVVRGGISNAESAASLIGRKRAISDLREHLSAAQSQLTLIEGALVSARTAIEGLRSGIQAAQERVQSYDVRIASSERDVQRLSVSLDEARSRVSRLEAERNEIDALLDQTQREKVDVETTVAALQARREELEAFILRDDSALESQNVELEARESALQEVRAREAACREKVQGLRREIESARAMVADREKRLLEVTRLRDRASQDRTQYASGDAELEARIEQLTRELGVHRDELAQVRDHLEQINSGANQMMDRARSGRRNLEEKSARLTELSLEAERISGELGFLIQNLEEKYGVGCLDRAPLTPEQTDMGNPVITLEMTAEEEKLLAEEVEQLRERIRRLGEVNPMAAEEYEELKKRFDHLDGEKRDLLQSIENLRDAIDHINRTSEERFQKAFEAIANRFEKLFPIIFGGGRAELSLVYPEGSTDILDAGVDILAQPPGKKIANITLLSGGEKALTAISLIFAIFMVKPSPFCLLDEVDAPLDDSNIGKFNALLREMSVKTQFILITHNKKTMELNDTLYGVTMEEPGVSKLVSIEMS